jgi:hypothetical protein
MRVICILCVWMIACSDPVPPAGGDVEQPDASRIIDRGAPIAPGQDVGVDPDRTGPAPVAIFTRLQYPETKAGDINAVGCQVVDAEGVQIIDLSPVVYIEPDRNIQRDVRGLSGTTPGDYRVFCSLPAYDLLDESPEAWTIVPGDAVALEAEVSSTMTVAGEVLTVGCQGVDAFGNHTAVDDAEYFVSPNTNGVELLGGGEIRISDSGTYQVGCRVAGLGEALEPLTVSPAGLSDIQISFSPNRVAYRVDELIEVQWSAEDGFGNPIENGIDVELALPDGGQLVGASRFRLALSGVFNIGVMVTDGVVVIRRTMELRIDDGAPTITCLSPGFGDQVLAAEGEGVTLTARVDDELAIESVFVGEQRVTPNSDGVFSVTVSAVFGPNVVKITAEDAIGERTSRLCGFSAAGQYLASQISVPGAIRLHLDDEALDDNEALPEYGSLGDVVRAFLNSEGLFEAIDDSLNAANPLVPEACRIPEVFGACGFSAGMTYRSLRVQGPNSASFAWANGGLNGTFRLTAVSVTGNMTGWALLVGDYVKELGLETDWIDGDLSVGIERGGTGALRVTNVSVNNLTLGEIRRIDPDPNGGFFEGLVDRFEDGILAVTDYFFRDMIVDYMAETIEEESAAYLDDLVASLGTTGVEGAFVLPTLDGGQDLGVAWQTAVEDLDVTAGGMLLAANARFTTDVNERRAMLGVPVPGTVRRPYLVGQSGSGAVVDFALINHVLTVLWESGYLDIDAAVVEYLGGVDLLGTSITAQLVAPPALSGTANGKLKIGIGPLEGRGSIPLIGLGEVVFRASGTVEAEVSVQDWQTLTLSDVEVTDLSLALDGVPIGAPGTSDFERGVRSLLGTIINNTLTNLLPSIPIPAFVMPVEYGRFGVPGNTRLGLLSGNLDIKTRDLELDGTFGEILP